MRILLVTNIFPPHIGGPATFIDQLAKALTKSKHRVTVVCSSDVPVEPSDAQRNFHVIRIPTKSYPLFIVKSILVLIFEMLIHRYIFVNGLEKQACVASLITRKKYVLKIVGDYIWENKRNQGATDLSIDDFQIESKTDDSVREGRAALFDRARLISVPSLYLRDLVVGWDVDSSRVAVVHNGIDQAEFRQYQPQRRQNKDFSCVFVGRLTNWKGIETFILAVQNLPDISASIIGQGPEYPLLRHLVRQLGLGDKVKFRGHLSREALKKELMSAHALVLPSLYEGLSHTLLEAMAMGIPCIASSSGGNREVIENRQDGLLVSPHDPAELSKAISELKDNEDFRMALATRAKEKSKIFDFQKTVEQSVALITETSL